jgi:hypothetical protein
MPKLDDEMQIVLWAGLGLLLFLLAFAWGNLQEIFQAR